MVIKHALNLLAATKALASGQFHFSKDTQVHTSKISRSRRRKNEPNKERKNSATIFFIYILGEVQIRITSLKLWRRPSPSIKVTFCWITGDTSKLWFKNQNGLQRQWSKKGHQISGHLPNSPRMSPIDTAEEISQSNQCLLTAKKQTTSRSGGDNSIRIQWHH